MKGVFYALDDRVHMGPYLVGGEADDAVAVPLEIGCPRGVSPDLIWMIVESPVYFNDKHCFAAEEVGDVGTNCGLFAERPSVLSEVFQFRPEKSFLIRHIGAKSLRMTLCAFRRAAVEWNVVHSSQS